MACIHYKFKSKKDYDTLKFDGVNISIADLKKEIIQQKKMGKVMENFELQILNAQTSEVYKNEDVIPKNTFVVVARVPIERPVKSRREARVVDSSHFKPAAENSTSDIIKKSDLTTMEATEEDKIKAMISQSSSDYDSSAYVKLKPLNPPRTYVCYGCNQPGHYIHNCPNPRKDQNDFPRLKRSTGIPNSFMTVVTNINQPGMMVDSQGNFVVPTIDKEAYAVGKKEKPPFVKSDSPPPAPLEDDSKKIPAELKCNICNNLLVDAVIIPCCGNSYCDECIRNKILESPDHACPDCGQPGQSPDDLVANRYLRQHVTSFINDTSYIQTKKVGTVPSISVIQKQAEEADQPQQAAAPMAPSQAATDMKQMDISNRLAGLPPQVVKAAAEAAENAMLLSKSPTHLPSSSSISSHTSVFSSGDNRLLHSEQESSVYRQHRNQISQSVPGYNAVNAMHNPVPDVKQPPPSLPVIDTSLMQSHSASSLLSHAAPPVEARNEPVRVQQQQVIYVDQHGQVLDPQHVASLAQRQRLAAPPSVSRTYPSQESRTQVVHRPSIPTVRGPSSVLTAQPPVIGSRPEVLQPPLVAAEQLYLPPPPGVDPLTFNPYAAPPGMAMLGTVLPSQPQLTMPIPQAPMPLYPPGSQPPLVRGPVGQPPVVFRPGGPIGGSALLDTVPRTVPGSLHLPNIPQMAPSMPGKPLVPLTEEEFYREKQRLLREEERRKMLIERSVDRNAVVTFDELQKKRSDRVGDQTAGNRQIEKPDEHSRRQQAERAIDRNQAMMDEFQKKLMEPRKNERPVVKTHSSSRSRSRSRSNPRTMSRSPAPRSRCRSRSRSSETIPLRRQVTSVASPCCNWSQRRSRSPPSQQKGRSQSRSLTPQPQHRRSLSPMLNRRGTVPQERRTTSPQQRRSRSPPPRNPVLQPRRSQSPTQSKRDTTQDQRSVSPLQRRSRSPQRPSQLQLRRVQSPTQNRRDTTSQDRRSPSPLQRRSRSPPRPSQFQHRRAQSPIQHRRGTTPHDRWSNSPSQKQSGSPPPRKPQKLGRRSQSSSPNRDRCVSPTQEWSRSPNRQQRSFSPVQRLHSPRRHRSKTPRSHSPLKNGRSPARQRKSRSPSMRQLSPMRVKKLPHEENLRSSLAGSPHPRHCSPLRRSISPQQRQLHRPPVNRSPSSPRSRPMSPAPSRVRASPLRTVSPFNRLTTPPKRSRTPPRIPLSPQQTRPQSPLHKSLSPSQRLRAPPKPRSSGVPVSQMSPFHLRKSRSPQQHSRRSLTPLSRSRSRERSDRGALSPWSPRNRISRSPSPSYQHKAISPSRTQRVSSRSPRHPAQSRPRRSVSPRRKKQIQGPSRMSRSRSCSPESGRHYRVSRSPSPSRKQYSTGRSPLKLHDVGSTKHRIKMSPSSRVRYQSPCSKNLYNPTSDLEQARYRPSDSPSKFGDRYHRPEPVDPFMMQHMEYLKALEEWKANMKAMVLNREPSRQARRSGSRDPKHSSKRSRSRSAKKERSRSRPPKRRSSRDEYHRSKRIDTRRSRSREQELKTNSKLHQRICDSDPSGKHSSSHKREQLTRIESGRTKSRENKTGQPTKQDFVQKDTKQKTGKSVVTDKPEHVKRKAATVDVVAESVSGLYDNRSALDSTSKNSPRSGGTLINSGSLYNSDVKVEGPKEVANDRYRSNQLKKSENVAVTPEADVGMSKIAVDTQRQKKISKGDSKHKPPKQVAAVIPMERLKESLAGDLDAEAAENESAFANVKTDGEIYAIPAAVDEIKLSPTAEAVEKSGQVSVVTAPILVANLPEVSRWEVDSDAEQRQLSRKGSNCKSHQSKTVSAIADDAARLQHRQASVLSSVVQAATSSHVATSVGHTQRGHEQTASSNYSRTSKPPSSVVKSLDAFSSINNESSAVRTTARSAVDERKVSVLDEDKFEPDYDETENSELDQTADQKSTACMKESKIMKKKHKKEKHHHRHKRTSSTEKEETESVKKKHSKKKKKKDKKEKKKKSKHVE